VPGFLGVISGAEPPDCLTNPYLSHTNSVLQYCLLCAQHIDYSDLHLQTIKNLCAIFRYRQIIVMIANKLVSQRPTIAINQPNFTQGNAHYG